MSCGCTDPCQPNSIPCTCEVRVTSDCVTVSGATSNCLAIDDNLLLTDYLTQMDERICEKVDSVTNFIALENVGTGSELYKGDSLLGKKQIRTVKSLDPNLVVTETADEIQLDLNIPAIVPPDGTETKVIAGIFKSSCISSAVCVTTRFGSIDFTVLICFLPKRLSPLYNWEPVPTFSKAIKFVTLSTFSQILSSICVK